MLLTAAVFKESTNQLCFSADPVLNSQYLDALLNKRKYNLVLQLNYILIIPVREKPTEKNL